MTRAIDPTEGRVYGGANNLIHIPDGERKLVGTLLAEALDANMRHRAVQTGARTATQTWSPTQRQPLCPGCYMVAIVATAVALAERNGQSITELGNSLSRAFADLAKNGSGERNMEWIDVQLDAEPLDGDYSVVGERPKEVAQAFDTADPELILAWNRATFGGYPL